MPKLTINMTSEQHMQVKVLASLSGQNIKDYVISKVITDNKVASPRLLAAINESKNKASLKTYKNIEELFKKSAS